MAINALRLIKENFKLIENSNFIKKMKHNLLDT